ncbi:glycoprotein 3-alpha-L-fucosyltransferase A-like [Varroa jacobsoni]|uniref:glycoprotein 3-alpha-L-fucosyltransferase A-like n=1 Tax=Varroa jacobsoni TaxID=62625 RepID=UPI000BF8F9FC|nr:glycoprotein 3-alpha-L-fucosyltransferase A-like [Varroa jacobsoni]XP_022694794.1 glycoprotein 3-alpha-L-fucosyltransferase A-like [Varroa jacobsoni]
MLTFKKLRRVVLVSCLLSCGAYVYFIVPTFHTSGIPVSVQPLASGPALLEARGPGELQGLSNNIDSPPSPSRFRLGANNRDGGNAVSVIAFNDLKLPLPQKKLNQRVKLQQHQKKQQQRQQGRRKSRHRLVRIGPNRRRGLRPNRIPGKFTPASVADVNLPDGPPSQIKESNTNDDEHNNVNANGDSKIKESRNSGRPWFFHNGSKRPLPGERGNLWPHENPDSDRIVEQLMFMPLNSSGPLKKIFLQRSSWGGLPLGQSLFLRDNCPVNRCAVTDNAEEAHALLFKDRYIPPPGRRHPDQVYILYLLECPMHTPGFRDLGSVFNWTATYRHDSDLVAPYEKWVPYPDVTEDPSTEESPQDIAGNNQGSDFDKRTKDVAWFVSNCNARNGRLQFARKLGTYIGVDVFGACGNKNCPRYNKSCFKMLDTTYKFYLAFENSNCKDYITEKFFVNGLNHSIVPVVMGARKSEYTRVAPANSFIHVDDFSSPKELAEYLSEISHDRERWESYLQSRRRGELINTFFFCRLCAMLHDDVPRKVYPDIHAWWADSDVCTSHTWKPEPKQAGREPAYKFL